MVRATSARSFLGVSVEGSTSSSKSSSACVRVAMDVFQYRLHLSFCSRGLMSTFMWSSRLSGRVKASFGDRGVEVMSSLQPPWERFIFMAPTRLGNTSVTVWGDDALAPHGCSQMRWCYGSTQILRRSQ